MLGAVLLAVGLEFCLLSLAAFGGAPTITPALQQFVVDQHHWMSKADFLQLYAVARVAPGPNMLFTSVLGWKIAGILGLLVATAAILAPSSLICLALGRLAVRYEETPIVQALKAGLAPVAVGLILASGIAISRAADANWLAWALTAAGAAWVLFAKANPLWVLVLGGALTGLLALTGHG